MDNSVVSFILGVLSSLFVWWIITHFFSPKVYFSDKILVRSGSEPDDKKPIFVAKFWNAKNRAIIDIDVFVYVEIKNSNLDEAGQNLYLDTSVSKIPRISRRTSTGISIDFSKLHEAFGSRVSHGYESGIESLKVALSDPRFEGLYIVVFGFDEFSGARKMFTSRMYNIDSVQF